MNFLLDPNATKRYTRYIQGRVASNITYSDVGLDGKLEGQEIHEDLIVEAGEEVYTFTFTFSVLEYVLSCFGGFGWSSKKSISTKSSLLDNVGVVLQCLLMVRASSLHS